MDRYIAGVPCWVDLAVADPDAAAAFYGSLFGWDLEDSMPPDAPGRYLMARIRGEDVAAIASPADGDPAWQTYVWVQDADATAEAVRAAGGTVLTEPFDVGDSGRMAVFTDPAGARFAVWQPGRHRGATVVNEPGAVNFNDLHTNDLAGAQAFYGAVFGWDLVDLGAGSAWALPAYGDFLEQRTPGLRERMATMGAPERFAEVVASVSQEPDAAAHWSVTFGVADADDAARRASELGGRVVVEPFDAPWVRMAVIADPAGATFTASQFVPPEAEPREAGTGAEAA